MTPFGRDGNFGTDTKGYVAAEGNVSITRTDGTIIAANKLLIIDDENNSKSFEKGVGLGQTISRWYYGSDAVKSLGGVTGKVFKAKELTKRNASNNATTVKVADINAQTEQARIAAETPEVIFE
jgi:lipopolysaccharide assembly outer membrane protein LptD (OstA)